MKTILVPAGIPEKRDIIESWNSLTNEEITRFVCEFEGLKNIQEFTTKTIPTKKFGDVQQIQTVRIDTWDNNIKWTEEFYSGKTVTVYRVSHIQDTMYFEKILFRDDLGRGKIKYGLDSDTATAAAWCTKHNEIISIQPNWLDNYHSECSKCQNDILEIRKKQENYQG